MTVAQNKKYTHYEIKLVHELLVIFIPISRDSFFPTK